MRARICRIRPLAHVARLPVKSVVRQALAGSVNAVPFGLRRSIRRVPGLAGLQRWLVGRFLSDRPFVHEINAGPAAGLRFEVTLPLDKLVWTGTYEDEFSAALGEAVEPGDVCYDIGGYRGFSAGIMALAGAAKVFVFEPVAANQRAISRLCSLNPTLPLQLLPMAVGRTDGVVRLKVMPDSSMAKLADSDFQADVPPVEEIEVTACRIDTLVAAKRIPPPDVIKIDVEGAELDVLRGAAGTLRDGKPTVLVEVHTSALARACAEELVAMGYRVRPVEPDRDEHVYPRHLLATV